MTPGRAALKVEATLHKRTLPASEVDEAIKKLGEFYEKQKVNLAKARWSPEDMIRILFRCFARVDSAHQINTVMKEIEKEFAEEERKKLDEGYEAQMNALRGMKRDQETVRG